MPAPRPLRTRDFLTLVRDTTLPHLGDHLGHPQARVVFSSLQIHFGDPRLHYEVWPVRKTGRLEIGLHLEGPQDWSRALAARLAGHADELRRALGPDYELEDWTASWCRLHRTLPLEPLSPALADAVAARLAALIRVTEPLLRRLDPPAPPASSPSHPTPSPRSFKHRRHFRRRRRAPA